MAMCSYNRMTVIAAFSTSLITDQVLTLEDCCRRKAWSHS